MAFLAANREPVDQQRDDEQVEGQRKENCQRLLGGFDQRAASLQNLLAQPADDAARVAEAKVRDLTA